MKTQNVTDRMGVYKRLSEVPTEYRLERFSAELRHRDVWEEWVGEEWSDCSEYQREVLERAGREWKKHMKDYGRHHALADPYHVEEWTAKSLEQRSVGTTYNRYWVKIEQFYTWLMRHTDFGHVYHPLWMSVVKYPDGASSQVWAVKIAEVRGS